MTDRHVASMAVRRRDLAEAPLDRATATVTERDAAVRGPMVDAVQPAALHAAVPQANRSLKSAKATYAAVEAET